MLQVPPECWGSRQLHLAPLLSALLIVRVRRGESPPRRNARPPASWLLFPVEKRVLFTFKAAILSAFPITRPSSFPGTLLLLAAVPSTAPIEAQCIQPGTCSAPECFNFQGKRSAHLTHYEIDPNARLQNSLAVTLLSVSEFTTHLPYCRNSPFTSPHSPHVPSAQPAWLTMQVSSFRWDDVLFNSRSCSETDSPSTRTLDRVKVLY